MVGERKYRSTNNNAFQLYKLYLLKSIKLLKPFKIFSFAFTFEISLD